MADNSLLKIDLVVEEDDEVVMVVEEIMKAEVDLTMNQKIMVEETKDHTEAEAMDMEEEGIINLIFNVMNAIDMAICQCVQVKEP